MTTYFIGTTDGQVASGYLVANGDVYAARSGAHLYGRGHAPAGTYELGDGDPLASSESKSMAQEGSDWTTARKFEIAGVGPSYEYNAKEGKDGIKDPRFPDNSRTGIRFHFDGKKPGTEGCVGYDDPAAQTSLTSAYDAGDREVQIIYVKTAAEAREMAKRLSGKEPPVDLRSEELAATKPAPVEEKPKAAAKPGKGKKGETSKTKKGARLTQGEPTVRLGQKQLLAAHVDARHSGGGRIAEGSPTVFVGAKRRAFGRVQDPTTDGSKVASGDESILVG